MSISPASLFVLLVFLSPVAFALPQMAVRVAGQDGKAVAADAVRLDVRRVLAADGGTSLPATATEGQIFLLYSEE